MQNRLKILREDRRWSQPKLSFESGIPQTTISAVERGVIVPSVQAAAKLADALDCTIEDLFPKDVEAV